jgi:hypothetical protein
VAQRNRQGNRDESGSDRSLKPLIDEYLASTREPVGSRNLFRETPDQSDQAGPRARTRGRDEVASAEPAAIMLYLICVAVLLIAALALGFF